MADAQDLERFVEAQAPVIDAVRAELAAGEKRTHWMWFVFPQLAGPGRSQTARFFGLNSSDEATAYWRHPLLGPRLVECCSLLLPHADRSPERIFGTVDALKLRSCLTLFERVAPEEPLFADLIDELYAGERDPATRSLLSGERRGVTTGGT